MKYLAIIAKVENSSNYAGWFADPITAFATGKTRIEVESKMPRILAAYLNGMGDQAAPPSAQSLADADPESFEGAEDIKTLWVEPASISAVSLEIERAIKTSGLTQTEVARRSGMHRSAVARLVDPFYDKHSWDSLQRVATALEARLEPPRFVLAK